MTTYLLAKKQSNTPSMPRVQVVSGFQLVWVVARPLLHRPCSPMRSEYQWLEVGCEDAPLKRGCIVDRRNSTNHPEAMSTVFEYL